MKSMEMDEKAINYYALTTTFHAIIHSPHDLDVNKTAQLLLAIPTQVLWHIATENGKLWWKMLKISSVTGMQFVLFLE